MYSRISVLAELVAAVRSLGLPALRPIADGGWHLADGNRATISDQSSAHARLLNFPRHCERLLAACLIPILLSTVAVRALPAQRDVRLEVILPSNGQRGNEAPTVTSDRVLSDSRTRDLLRHGFPARLHYRLALWSSAGWFDDEKATAEWDVIVRFTPLDRRYAVTRIEPDRVVPLGTFDDLGDVEAVIGYPHRPSIRPPTQRARHYYHLVLGVEMLSVNDLDEVERWLRGELRPAVRGKRNPGTALTRGVRSLLVGLLGGENRKYEARTGRFVP
ncbi:MAG: hypothetical protein H7Z74_05570 [Anaerolineae bacterium]|nr:hypothetical protein [Gemmatimonadaceae bacterium]